MNQKGISLITIILIIIGILVAAGGALLYANWYAINKTGRTCVNDGDCVVFGKSGDCNCGCFNKNCKWWWRGLGKCFCAAPTSCKCVNGTCQGVFDKIANWKTYRNEQYGFEVKYPPTLKVWENQQSGKAIYGVSFENPLADHTTAGRKIVFSVFVFNNSSQMQDEYKSLSIEDKGEIIIDGHSAKNLFRPISPSNTLTETTVYLITDKSISMHFQGADFHKITESDMNQILSSFRFTK